jgi:hypothetical protein
VPALNACLLPVVVHGEQDDTRREERLALTTSTAAPPVCEPTRRLQLLPHGGRTTEYRALVLLTHVCTPPQGALRSHGLTVSQNNNPRLDTLTSLISPGQHEISVRACCVRVVAYPGLACHTEPPILCFSQASRACAHNSRMRAEAPSTHCRPAGCRRYRYL